MIKNFYSIHNNCFFKFFKNLFIVLSFKKLCQYLFLNDFFINFYNNNQIKLDSKNE